MEFLVFALLNLVTGLVLYVLFSLRLQAWQEKIRTAHPMQKDVEENIRQGLQSMNEYLEEMQEVRNNFYQLLRHADELSQKLDKPPVKRRKRSASDSPDTGSTDTTSSSPDVPTGSMGSSGARPRKNSPTSEEEGTEHIGRILDRMKPDSVDLSTRADTNQPRSLRPEPKTSPIEGLGRLAASLFGMKSFELPFGDSKTDPDSGSGPRESSGRDSSARDSRTDSLDLSPPSLPVHLPEAVADNEARDSALPPGRKRPELNLPNDEFAEPLQPEGDPHNWIRNLIASGMNAGDVSRLTGKTLAEIELIASLPQLPAQPRRKRLGGDGN